MKKLIGLIGLIVVFTTNGPVSHAESPTLEDLVFKAMIRLSPPERPHEELPGWSETPEARTSRYRLIAADIAAVSSERCSTEECSKGVAAALVGVAWHESGFAPDVDLGPCYRGRNGKSPRCDGGRAVTLWQIRTGGEERELIMKDRRAAARLAARRIRRSLGSCRKFDRRLRLSAYAGGRCSDKGREAEASSELVGAIDQARVLLGYAPPTPRS